MYWGEERSWGELLGKSRLGGRRRKESKQGKGWFAPSPYIECRSGMRRHCSGDQQRQ